MKRLLIIFSLTLLTSEIIACSCRGIADYYSFFKKNTTSFVGKVISSTVKEGYTAYTFQIIDKLRTSLQGTVIINNKNIAAGCTAYFQEGQIYLVTPGKINGELNVTSCSFIETSKYSSFSEDTLLINLLNKRNAIIESRYFKGEIKNGKRIGTWAYYIGDASKIIISTGKYIDDRKDGEWIEGNTKTYYKKGKFLKMIEFIGDSLNKVETFNHEKTMYYVDGKIHKKLNGKLYTVFSKTGKIIETAKVKKNGYFTDEWIILNEDGSIKDKLKVDKKENLHSAWEEFYDTEVHENFSKWRYSEDK